jgi:hypothetical protein
VFDLHPVTTKDEPICHTTERERERGDVLPNWVSASRDWQAVASPDDSITSSEAVPLHPPVYIGRELKGHMSHFEVKVTPVNRPRSFEL